MLQPFSVVGYQNSIIGKSKKEDLQGSDFQNVSFRGLYIILLKII
jgi:hypothetical protein